MSESNSTLCILVPYMVMKPNIFVGISKYNCYDI